MIINDIIKRLSPIETNQEVERLMEAVGLLEKANAVAKTLSGGMKRKLSVAISLVGNPRLLFLDEPTAGLSFLIFFTFFFLFFFFFSIFMLFFMVTCSFFHYLFVCRYGPVLEKEDMGIDSKVKRE